VNVWIALTYEGHAHHRAAREWFESLGVDARLSFCRITQIAFLRLLTTEAVMKDEVLSQARAWKTYDQWFEDERISFLQEPSGLEPAFRRKARSPHPTPKDWADSYLAAFAASANLVLVTFDHPLQQRTQPSVLLLSTNTPAS
jgi:hypothetical protein